MKKSISIIVSSMFVFIALGTLSTKNVAHKEVLTLRGVTPNHLCTGFADPNTGIAYCVTCGNEIRPGSGMVVQ